MKEATVVKSITCFALAVLLISLLAIPRGPAHAFAPYATLYGDTLGGSGGEGRTRCWIIPPPPAYTTIEVWVWFLPDNLGMSGAEFKLTYPSATYLIQGPVTSNPLNQVEVGTLNSGMSVSVGGSNCQHDWYWTHRQELVTRVQEEMEIKIVGHPGNGGHISVVDCSEGFPFKDCMVLCYFALYWNYPNATRETTWGAIKNLYIE
jgi:hypothetical protein